MNKGRSGNAANSDLTGVMSESMLKPYDEEKKDEVANVTPADRSSSGSGSNEQTAKGSPESDSSKPKVNQDSP